jgi:hypothetical protein
MARKSRVVKTVDEEADISCFVGKGKVREEVWLVLGYDVAHGIHHRHIMGHVEAKFSSYEKLSERFSREVAVLRKKGAV